MTKVMVDVGVACSKQQANQWVGSIIGEMMRVAGEGRILFGQSLFIGSALTDFNRCQIVKKFLDGTSDYLYFLDDDVVPPSGALETLLEMKTPITAGIYFLRRPPCNPVAYHRNSDNKLYYPIKFNKDEIVSVDSVGMGCTLIHRSVFEKIQSEYNIYRRKENGSLRLVHNSKVVPAGKINQVKRQAGKVLGTTEGSYFIEELEGPIDLGDKPFPFYQFEYGRTEDHFWCELAKKVGYSILVNTAISCLHWGSRPISESSYRDLQRWSLQQEKSNV